MFVLFILAAFAVYLLVSIAVVKRTKRWARATGRSSTRWAWGAAVVMYLLVFWDWIPFLLVRHHYCAKEAGLFVYQTLEQWKAANPGWKVPAPIYYPGQAENFGKGFFYLNTRFRLEIKDGPTAFTLLPLARQTQSLVDTESGAVIARFVTFYGTGHLMSGNSWDDYKFWMGYRGCGPTTNSAERDFSTFTTDFRHLGKELGDGE